MVRSGTWKIESPESDKSLENQLREALKGKDLERDFQPPKKKGKGKILGDKGKSLLPAKIDHGQKEKEMVSGEVKKILIDGWVKKLKNIEEERGKGGDPTSEEEIKKRYFEDVANMAEIIKEVGIDRIVTHGNPIYDKRTDWGLGSGYDTGDESKKLKPEGEAVEIKPDFDTQASTELLNRINENNEKPIFNEGSFTETIRSGSSRTTEKTKSWQVIFYIDVGNKNTSIEVDEKTKIIKIYADHHGEANPFVSSSTQTLFDIAEAGKFSLVNKNLPPEEKEKEEKYLENLVESVNKYDNIEFLDVKKDPSNPNSIPLVNESFLKENYVTSFYFLAKHLPFEIKQEILGKSEKFYKDGKPRDLFYTFTKGEINNTDIGNIETTDTKIENRKLTKYERSKGEKGPKIVARKLTLKELVEKYQGDIDKTVEGATSALDSMEKKGISIDSPTIGKFIFHNLSSFMKDNLAYITARAMGYPSYVRRDPATGIIFINSDGKHDLMPIWRKINAIVPGYPKPTRNRFMYGPKDPEMQKKVKELISEEKLFEIIQNAEPEAEIEAEITPTFSPVKKSRVGTEEQRQRFEDRKKEKIYQETRGNNEKFMRIMRKEDVRLNKKKELREQSEEVQTALKNIAQKIDQAMEKAEVEERNLTEQEKERLNDLPKEIEFLKKKLLELEMEESPKPENNLEKDEDLNKEIEKGQKETLFQRARNQLKKYFNK